jgi:predicted acetyltransferase
MQGYGSAMLELAIPKVRELGIDRILLTCNASNVGSRKIIEKNGGVLENEVIDTEKGTHKLRFWIEK